MFSGIVEQVGTVHAVHRRGDVLVARIATVEPLHLPLGGSIAVGGCCLTATVTEPLAFECELTEETLRRTSFEERLRPGARINLERPLRADGRLDGHIVQGHVDAVGTVRGLRLFGASADLEVGLPPELERYVVLKGSIAIDGVSLTVARLRPGSLDIALIPFTLENTSLGGLREGDRVNLEADVIAKYVERLLQFKER
jgi:riboflavin synthase